MTKHLTEFEKGSIKALRNAGYSYADIAREVNRSERTIRYYFAKLQETGSRSRRKGTGAKRITTPREDRALVRESKRSRHSSATELAEKLGLSISRSTVSRRLKEKGITSHFTSKKPKISNRNMRKRVAWCRAHQHWTIILDVFSFLILFPRDVSHSYVERFLVHRSTLRNYLGAFDAIPGFRGLRVILAGLSVSGIGVDGFKSIEYFLQTFQQQGSSVNIESPLCAVDAQEI